MHFGELRAEIRRALYITGNTAAALQHTAPGNVVPLGRSLSDALRLRLAGAQLSRAASRRPDELGGAARCHAVALPGGRALRPAGKLLNPDIGFHGTRCTLDMEM